MTETDELLTEIDKKLQALIQLVALSLSQGQESLGEKARRLQKAGMAPKDIAALLDTTPNTISVQLSRKKRRAGKGKQPAKKK